MRLCSPVCIGLSGFGCFGLGASFFLLGLLWFYLLCFCLHLQCLCIAFVVCCFNVIVVEDDVVRSIRFPCCLLNFRFNFSFNL